MAALDPSEKPISTIVIIIGTPPFISLSSGVLDCSSYVDDLDALMHMIYNSNAGGGSSPHQKVPALRNPRLPVSLFTSPSSSSSSLPLMVFFFSF